MTIKRESGSSVPFRRSIAACVALIAAAAAQAAGVEQWIDLERWIAVESRNFVIFTDAEPERGVELARNLERFRSAFAALGPGLELRSAVPTRFVAFRDRGSYAPYKSHPDSGGAVTLGQFLLDRDRNFLTLDASTRPGGDFAVIYHEFVHYLVAHNFARVPRWFHEGLAEYYSTFAVEDERVVVGRPVVRHLRWLRADNADRKVRLLSHDFSLRAVLTGESGHHGSRAGGFYALSWALVHHLLSGGPERLDRMAEFLVRLRDREDPDAAFEAAFDLRLDDLEETLRELAYREDTGLPPIDPSAEGFPEVTLDLADLGPQPEATTAPLPPADALFHLGDLQLRLGRLEWAEGHFQAALERDPEHAESLAGLALLRDYASRFEEAEVLYRDALAIGSDDPLTYLRYGVHLLAKILPEAAGQLVAAGKLQVAGELAIGPELAKSERLADAERTAGEARRAFAAAVDLDGEHAEARALFGYAHLFGDVDPKPGIRALQKARSWLPDRDDLTLFLLQLHLKDRAFDRARRLLDEDLREHAEPQVLLWAEEEIERARMLHAASQALADGETEEALRLFDQAIAVTSGHDLRERLAARLAELQRRYGVR